MELGKEYQTEFIARLTRKDVLKDVSGVVRPEWFTPPWDDVVSEVLAFWRRHKKPLSRGQFAQVCQRYDVEPPRPSAADFAFDKEELRRYGRMVATREAILKASTLNQEGHPEKAIEVVRNSVQAWPVAATNGQADILTVGRPVPTPKNVCSTGLSELDEIFKGGAWGGDLSVVLAATGGGKTSFLVWLASVAVGLGKKVLFVTLEVPAYEVEQRFRRCLTDSSTEPSAKVWGKMAKKLKRKKAALFVREYPPQSVSVDELDKDAPEDVKLIIVDYADYLRPPSGSPGMDYADLGWIYSDLKRIAMERCIPVWTASQVNRVAYSNEVFGNQDVEMSLRKTMIADRVISISQKEAGKVPGSSESYGLLHVAKNRKGYAFDTMELTIDFAKSKFKKGKWAD